MHSPSGLTEIECHFIILQGFLTGAKVLEIHVAIRRAYDAGILIVAAAGNNGVVEYPAAFDEVVAVGAVDAKGECLEGNVKEADVV